MQVFTFRQSYIDQKKCFSSYLLCWISLPLFDIAANADTVNFPKAH